MPVPRGGASADPEAGQGRAQVHILFVGDVVGRAGRRILREALPRLRERYDLELVVVNGENAAGGVGLTASVAQEILALGVDAITLGNHTWDKKELVTQIDALPAVLRPANYPPGTPGRGSLVARSRSGVAVGVVSVMGRVFSGVHLECPFRTVERELEAMGEQVRLRLVDFHAEATSEKQALGWFLDGRVTAVVGTHTHVPTADAAVLPGGTAYITDVGMTGPWVSVLGVDRWRVVEKFLTQMPVRFEVAKGPCQFNAVVIDADERTGLARSIEPVAWREPLDAAEEGVDRADDRPDR
jgi:metallophosphoesterase (TIGR00282 family)